jgi:hypothetical protein
MTWWILGAWKVKGYRGRTVMGLCLICGESEEDKHVNLRCGERAGRNMDLKCKEWLYYHEHFNKIFL